MPRQDFGKLDKLIKAAARVAQGAVGREALKAMGKVSFDLAVQGAQAGKNPAGRAWKPLKRGGTALRMMAGSLSLRVGLAQFRIASRYPWAGFHQRGAKARRKTGPLPPKGVRGASLSSSRFRLPKRAVLPKRSLPKPWKDPVYEAAANAWKRNWILR